MNLKAVVAIALAAISAPAVSADNSFASRLTWAVDVGTHIYNIEGMESFKPSLELGIHARLPLTTFEFGTLMVDTGLSQSVIYGSSELETPQSFQGNTLSAVQIDFRRLFVGLGLETSGTWFFKPQIGFEYNVTKQRLYDPDAGKGWTVRENDSNAFIAMGVGHRFPDGKKGILSLATLTDNDDQDFRLTYSASF